MYFAINPWPNDLPEKTAERLAAFPREEEHVYALLDSAFDETLLRHSRWATWPRRSLYADTPLQGLVAASPHLLALPGARERWRPWLESVIAACANRPMLSFIVTPLSMEALAGHLRPYLIARTPDGIEWPVRWADTRVQPDLFAALGPEHRTQLFSPLVAWIGIDRRGQLQVWEGEALVAPSAAEFDRWPLDDAAFARLVEGAEADAVLAEFDDSQPDLLRRHVPADTHDIVARHLAIASANGLDEAGWRRHFSGLALGLRDGFADHAEMQAIFARVRKDADYLAETRTLSTQFWQSQTPRE